MQRTKYDIIYINEIERQINHLQTYKHTCPLPCNSIIMKINFLFSFFLKHTLTLDTHSHSHSNQPKQAYYVFSPTTPQTHCHNHIQIPFVCVNFLFTLQKMFNYYLVFFPLQHYIYHLI